MNNNFKIMFTNFLIMGTIMAISSYSWFSMWMGLEINLISAIPLFLDPKNPLSAEASMKYFISQAIASTVIMFSMIMMLMKTNYTMNSNTMSSILNSMLMLKMGAAPLHFWFPEVMEGLSWVNCMILLTWQKISPMMIMFNNNPSTNLMLIFIMSSLIISPLMSMNQTSLRKIMAFSSISHISWMLSALMNSVSSWIVYFLTYSIMSVNVVMMLKSTNMFMVNQLMNSSKPIKTILMVNFMSMGGLPPFLGFLPKWIVINKFTSSSIFVTPLMLILSSLMMLYIYLRMFFPLLMMAQSKKKTFMKTPNNHVMILVSSILINSSLITATSMINLN